MALRSPGSNIPQVRSSLLGTYNPNLRQSVQNRISDSAGLGGAGGVGRNLNFQAPNLSELTAKYVKDIPQADIDTDPSKLYEQGMGGLRQDVQGAITEAGQKAISTAAASGREIADVMARYLPEAVKGFGRAAADVSAGASELAAQGKIAKSEIEIKRAGMAQEMARFDAAQQQQNAQFIAELQQQYQIAREQLTNNLRVAEMSARSASERQAIQNAHEMQMNQLNNQFKAQATQYAEAQANMRHSQQLALYDKYQKASAELGEKRLMLDATKAVEGSYPTEVTGGASSPQAGTITTQQGTYRFNPTTGKLERVSAGYTPGMGYSREPGQTYR